MFLRKLLLRAEPKEADLLRRALLKQKSHIVHVFHYSREGKIQVNFGETEIDLEITEISVTQHLFRPLRFCFLAILNLYDVTLSETEEIFLAKVLETQQGLVSFSLRHDNSPGVYGSFIPVAFSLSNVEHSRLITMKLLNCCIRSKNVQNELFLFVSMLPKLKRLGKLQLGFDCSVRKAHFVPVLKSAFCRLYDHREFTVRTYRGIPVTSSTDGTARRPPKNLMNFVEMERVGYEFSKLWLPSGAA